MILSIYGYQDSGKTSLIEKVNRDLIRKGYRVCSVKHTSSSGLEQREGKDTWRHAEGGSNPVALTGNTGTTIWIRGETSVESVVETLKTRYSPDVIIVEGLKEGPYPKVALGGIKPRRGTVLVNPSVKELSAYIIAEVGTERALGKLPGLDCGKCGLDCLAMAKAIANGTRQIQDCRELAALDVMIKIGGKNIAAGAFVSEIVDSTVRGMVSSLKGYERGKDVEIRLRARGRKSRDGPDRR
jgi:molybdopterin-guanine dinucleotide biosynthesis protein B